MPEPPEIEELEDRFRVFIKASRGDYEPGDEIDYQGVTLVRANTEEAMYYPKSIGKAGMVNASAHFSALQFEETIIETVGSLRDYE